MSAMADVEEEEFTLPQLSSELEAELSAEPGPVLVADREGVILFINGAASEFFGYGPDDLWGEFVETLLPKNLRWGHQRYRMGFWAEPGEKPMAIGMELEALHKDGSLKRMEQIDLKPIEVEGKQAIICYVRLPTE
jgi:PAS domain S-box-containing protein